MIYNFDDKYPLWKVTETEGRVLRIGQIMVDGEVVQTYPDNDGGRWYYNKNGEEVHVYD